MRILLVEDDKQMAAMLISTLSRYDMIIDHAYRIDIAREACRSSLHDAVLLDRKLPDGDGLSLIPYIRQERPGLPIIVMSALGAPHERVHGLDHGADDYLAKPFSIDELMARIRALMRRPTIKGESTLSVAKLQFDFLSRQATVNGQMLDLTRREVLALEILMKRAGRAVSRGALEEAMYDHDEDVTSNSLDAHISRLRRKLTDAEVQIHGIRGLGYLLRPAL